MATGYNDGGQICNLLVGGKVEVGRYGGDASQLGSLGGIVGKSKEGNIDTVAALSLNLSSTADNVNVGGIVGKIDKTNIDYAKFVSVVTEFGEFTVAGQIIGLNNVAGIVASSTLGTITNSSVESFVATINDEVFGVIGETFYTIKNGTEITDLRTVKTAGILADGTARISSSFVKANIFTNKTLILTSATNEEGRRIPHFVP